MRIGNWRAAAAGTAACLSLACLSFGPSGRAAQPAPAPEARAGCVGTALGACIVSLGAALSFDPNLLASQVARRNETDVNGRPISRTISLYAKVPGHLDGSEILLHLAAPAPNDTIARVAASLPADPIFARSEEEYDRTLLFPLMKALLGNRCLELDRIALYRFFENSVKPRIVSEKKLAKQGLFKRSQEFAHADKLAYCGASFSYTRTAQWNGDLNDDTQRGLKRTIWFELE
ncbi:MAG: hypothetical protein JO038_01430 [Alphaproteobacteria bacterium]|nr:hypothetical protein [Alphaproteobacteria bacterium]